MTTSDPYAAPTISEAWASSPEPDPQPVSLEADSLPAAGEPDTEESVPDGSVRDVVEWVDGDSARARRALVAERARPSPRKGVLSELEGLAAEE